MTTAFVPAFELYTAPGVDTISGVKVGDLTGRWFPKSFTMDINRWGVATANAVFHQSRFKQYGEIQRGREIRAWYNKAADKFWGKWWIKSISSPLQHGGAISVNMVGASAFYQSAFPAAAVAVENPTYRDVAEQLAIQCDKPLPYGTWTNTQFDTEPFMILQSANMLDVLKTLTTMDSGGIDSMDGGFMSTWDLYFSTVTKHELFQASVGGVPWATYNIGDDVEVADYSENDDDSYTHLKIVGHARLSEEDRRIWVFPDATHEYDAGITPCIVPNGATRIFAYDAKGISSLASAEKFWTKWHRVFVPLRPTVKIRVANVGDTIPLPARGLIKVLDEYGETLITQTPEKVSIQFVDETEREPRCMFEVGKPDVDWGVVLGQLESRILGNKTGAPKPQVIEARYKVTGRTGTNAVVDYTYDPTIDTFNFLYNLLIVDSTNIEAGTYLASILNNKQVKGKHAFNVGDIVTVVTLFDDQGVFEEQYITPNPAIDINNLVSDGTNVRSISDALGFKAGGTLAPKAT